MKKIKHFLFHVGVMGLFASYAPIQVFAGGICCCECNDEAIRLDAEDALIQAILQSNQVIATQLINQGADLEYKDDEGNTALNWAAYKGLLPIINLLIKNKANINNKNLSGRTPLMCAAFSGETKAVRVLIAYGAPLDTLDNDNKTALIIALEEEFTSIITVLEDKMQQKQSLSEKFISQEKEELDNMCVICYEPLQTGSNYAATKCGHAFHLGCLHDVYMYGQPCPMCRQEIIAF